MIELEDGAGGIIIDLCMAAMDEERFDYASFLLRVACEHESPFVGLCAVRTLYMARERVDGWDAARDSVRQRYNDAGRDGDRLTRGLYTTLAERLLAESPARSDVRTRVDAWLDVHATWVEESRDRQWRRTQWQACAKMFGSTSDSALGVLLGLVRLAWGETGLTTTEWWTGWGISSGKWDCAGQRWPSEVEALVSALEYAPC